MDKKTIDLMFSSKSDEHATEQEFFDFLNNIFHFTLDPCATKANAKCKNFYTIEDDGLQQDWQGESVYVNNPYSKSKDWTRKCAEEGNKKDTTVVQLIPSRTDTKYSQDMAFPNCVGILFVKGRLRFGGAKSKAPFPSMVVVYSDRELSPHQVLEMSKRGTVVIPAKKIGRYKEFFNAEED